jgi:hypothetical protein
MRPKELQMTKKDQAAVLKLFKTTIDARKIANMLGLRRHMVMFFLESKGLSHYSVNSYK